MRRNRRVLLLCGVLAVLLCFTGQASALETVAELGGENRLPALYFTTPLPGEIWKTELELVNSETEARAVYLNTEGGKNSSLLLSVWKDGGLICRKQPAQSLFLGALRPGERARFIFAAEADEAVLMGGSEKRREEGKAEALPLGTLWTLETSELPTSQPSTGAVLPEEQALCGTIPLAALFCLAGGLLRTHRKDSRGKR